MKRAAYAAVIFTFCAADAFACGVCTTAAFDYLLPPIVLWMVIAMTWFISNGVLRSVTGAVLPFQPAVLGALAVVIAALFASGAGFGPATILPLAIPPAYAFGRSFLKKRSGETALRVIGVVHVIAIVITIGIMVHVLRTRTDAQFITQWSGTVIARGKFARLRLSEPASLKTYREIAASNDAYMAGNAAERIGEIGQAAVDIPLLQKALVKFGNDSDAKEKISAALFRLRTRRVALKSS